DRRAAVGLEEVSAPRRRRPGERSESGAADARLDGGEDAQRILGAGVVGRDDDEVASPARRLAHERALAGVAVAAAAEYGQEPALRERAEHVEEPRERIGRVRVVHDHREARAGDLLEASGRRRRRVEPAGDRIERYSE